MLVSVFSVHLGFAQTARDYFFPSKSNSSQYKMRELDGGKKFFHNKTVYLRDMRDSALVTTMFFDNDGIKGGQEQLLKVTDSTICVVKGKANTSPGRIQTYAGDGLIAFKMPPATGQSEWPEKQDRGRGSFTTIYRSEFAILKVNRKKVRAVKVSCIHKRRHNGNESVFCVDYYVAGIGYYKRTTENGLELEDLAKQQFDPNVPSVN
jgi:hypothetical protein